MKGSTDKAAKVQRRERYAIAALQGLLAKGSGYMPEKTCLLAWTIADEMERTRTVKPELRKKKKHAHPHEVIPTES